MDFHPCASTEISHFGYDAKARVLALKFHRGGTYSYREVDEPTFQRFLAALSKGRFFRENILGRFEFEGPAAPV